MKTMPVGSDLTNSPLTPCITIALAIVIIATIVTRSKTLLILGSSLLLLWCLDVILKYVYKRITEASENEKSDEEDGECREEDKEIQDVKY